MNKSLFLPLILLFLLASSVQAQTVYVTNTGEKYHKGTCRYLSQSKIETTVEKAKKEGYGACKVCKPPSTRGSTYVAPAKSAPSGTTSVQCSGTTQKGNRCKRMTKSASGRCYQH